MKIFLKMVKKHKKIIMIVILLIGSLLLFSDVKNNIFDNKKEDTSLMDLKGANVYRYVNLNEISFNYGDNASKGDTVNTAYAQYEIKGLLESDKISSINLVVEKYQASEIQETKKFNTSNTNVSSATFNNAENFIHENADDTFRAYIEVAFEGGETITSNRKSISYVVDNWEISDYFATITSFTHKFEYDNGRLSYEIQATVPSKQDSWLYVRNLETDSEFDVWKIFSNNDYFSNYDEDGNLNEYSEYNFVPGKYLGYLSRPSAEETRSKIIEFEVKQEGDILTSCTECTMKAKETKNLETTMSEEYKSADKKTGFEYTVTAGEDVINVSEDGVITALKDGTATIQITKEVGSYTYIKEIAVYVGIDPKPSAATTDNEIKVVAGYGSFKKWYIKYCEYDESQHEPSCQTDLDDLNTYNIKELTKSQLSYTIGSLKSNQRYYIIVATVSEDSEILEKNYLTVYTRYQKPSAPDFTNSDDKYTGWFNVSKKDICITLYQSGTGSGSKFQYAVTRTNAIDGLEFKNHVASDKCSNDNMVNISLSPGENYVFARIAPTESSKNNASDPSDPLLIKYDNTKPVISKIELSKFNDKINVTVTASDTFSMIAKYQFKIDGESDWQDMSEYYTFNIINKKVKFRVLDKAGNISDEKEEYIGANDIVKNETSTYEIEKSTDEKTSFISNITKNTDITEFKNNFSEFEAKIYGKNTTVGADGTVSSGSEITTGKIGSGMLIVTNNNKNVYRAVVKGDLTGDGEINIADATKSLKSIATKVKTLEDYEEKAGDVTGDKKLAVNDVVKIAKFLVKKAEI